MVALAPAAFAQKVSVEYSHHIDFSKFKTYRWGKNKGELTHKFEDAHVRHKIDRILEAKGLSKVDSNKADLIVTYQATDTKQEEQVDNYAGDPGLGYGPGMGMGWGSGWGWGWGDGGDYGATAMATIRRGDLLVDMLDPATKSIVFRGYARGAFHSNPIKDDKLMSKALGKMFKNFPPKE